MIVVTLLTAYVLNVEQTNIKRTAKKDELTEIFVSFVEKDRLNPIVYFLFFEIFANLKKFRAH